MDSKTELVNSLFNEISQEKLIEISKEENKMEHVVKEMFDILIYRHLLLLGKMVK